MASREGDYRTSTGRIGSENAQDLWRILLPLLAYRAQRALASTGWDWFAEKSANFPAFLLSLYLLARAGIRFETPATEPGLQDS
jgi:hypothetical protein